MKKTLIVAFLTSLLSISAIATAQGVQDTAGPEFPTYPKIHYGNDAKSQQIKHGEYLVQMGDCMACHTDTKNHGTPFAGGLQMPTPFGIFVSPNITPDKKFGIGSWTTKHFIRAMHEGVRADGKYMFPVFPYLWYTKIHDKDLVDIKAYLDAIPPVHKAPIADDVPFPFDIRFSQLGWRIMFFKKGYFQYDPKKSKQWNRGAYLVEGLGHCGMCHTPINFLGGPKRSYAFTGNVINGQLAPNISGNGPIVSKASIQDILNVFQKDQLIGGGKIVGAMLEVNKDSLSHINIDDLTAIATYIKSTHSKQPKTVSLSTVVTKDTGKKVYGAYCYACHDSGAGGAPRMGSKADWDKLIKQNGMTGLYHNAIEGLGAMPPKGTCTSCTNAQIQATVNYMIDYSNKAKQTAPLHVPPPKPITMAQGKVLYTQHCAICHADGKNGAPKMGDDEAWAPRIQHGGMELLALHAIHGYKGHPKRGNCAHCNDGQIIAATKWLVQHSQTGKDYSLW